MRITETIDGWEEEAVLAEDKAEDEDMGWETGSEDVMNSPARSKHSSLEIARTMDEVPDCPELTDIPGWSVESKIVHGSANTDA